MALGVVDVLETIKVDEQGGQRRAGAARLLDRGTEAFTENAAVWQSGKAVELGKRADVLLGFARLGHVLQRSGHQGDPAGAVAFSLGLDVEMDDAAVLGACADVEIRLSAIADQYRQSMAQPRQVVVVNDGLEHLHRERSARIRHPEQRKANLGAGHKVRHMIPLPDAQACDALGACQHGAVALELLASARRAQQVAGPLGQQHPLRRLHEEVGGARLVCLGHRLLVVQSGEHEDGYLHAAGQPAQCRTGCETVHAGHHCIEQYAVDAGGELFDGFRSAGGLDDAEAVLGKDRRSQQAGDRVVVHQQDTVLRCLRFTHRDAPLGFRVRAVRRERGPVPVVRK